MSELLLSEIGMDIRNDPVSLELFRAAGADVAGERVRFDPGLVRSLCATAPSQFTQQARSPARYVQIGGDVIVFAPAYGSPFVRDLQGGRRYGSIADFENFVKLTYATPALHRSGGTVWEPVDVPVNSRACPRFAHRWSTGSPRAAALALLGRVHSIEGARRPGDDRVHRVDTCRDSVRRKFHPPFGWLAGGRPHNGV